MAPEQEQELKAGDGHLVKLPRQGSSDKSITTRHDEVKLKRRVRGRSLSVRYLARQRHGWDVAEAIPFTWA